MAGRLIRYRERLLMTDEWQLSIFFFAGRPTTRNAVRSKHGFPRTVPDRSTADKYGGLHQNVAPKVRDKRRFLVVI